MKTSSALLRHFCTTSTGGMRNPISATQPYIREEKKGERGHNTQPALNFLLADVTFRRGLRPGRNVEKKEEHPRPQEGKETEEHLGL